MIEFDVPVAFDPEVLAHLITRYNSHWDVMQLILALDEYMADLHFTKELRERLDAAIAVEEGDDD